MSVLLAGDFKASEASPSAPGAHVQPATTATNADSWHFLVNNNDHRRMYDDKKTIETIYCKHNEEYILQSKDKLSLGMEL